MTQLSNSVKVSTLIDARGPRFGAAITTVVFGGSARNYITCGSLLLQAVVFAIGAI